MWKLMNGKSTNQPTERLIKRVLFGRLVKYKTSERIDDKKSYKTDGIQIILEILGIQC